MEKNIDVLVKNSSFCALAWLGLAVNTEGVVTPCCLFDQPILDKNKQDYKIHKNDLEEILNCDFLKETRKKMLKGERINECKQCYERESFGELSFRNQSNKDYLHILKTINLDNDFPIIALDLKLGNKCNLRCRMCQPKDSNQIFNEFEGILKENYKFSYYSNTELKHWKTKESFRDLSTWTQSDKFMKTMTAILPDLRVLCIAGGEPLINDSFYNIIDLAIKSGKSKRMRLCVTSNFLNINLNKLITYFNYFEEIIFLISFDATEKQLEYIRYPSKQELIISNFKKAFIDAKAYEQVKFQFALTVQLYNLLYIPDIFKLIEKLYNEGYTLSYHLVSFTYLIYPTQLSIHVAPQNVRNKAIEKLNLFKKTTTLFKISDRFEKEVEQLITAIEISKIDDQERLLSEFLYYSNMLDEKRNQSLKAYLPELSKLLNEINLNQSEPPPYFIQRVLRHKGWKCFEEKKYHEAINCFNESLKITNTKFQEYKGLGLVYLEIKDFKKAYENLKNAFIIDENNFEVLEGLTFTTLSLGLRDEATDFFKRALQLIYLKINKFHTSYKSLKKTCTFSENNFKILKELTLAALALGINDEAAEYYKKAIDIDKEDPELLQAGKYYKLEQDLFKD